MATLPYSLLVSNAFLLLIPHDLPDWFFYPIERMEIPLLSVWRQVDHGDIGDLKPKSYLHISQLNALSRLNWLDLYLKRWKNIVSIDHFKEKDMVTMIKAHGIIIAHLSLDYPLPAPIAFLGGPYFYASNHASLWVDPETLIAEPAAISLHQNIKRMIASMINGEKPSHTASKLHPMLPSSIQEGIRLMKTQFAALSSPIDQLAVYCFPMPTS